MPGDYERTQKAILESAKTNFLACGYERANLRKICKDAGITTGALYRHFPDKKALFSALVAPVVKELNGIFQSAEEACLGLIGGCDIDQAYRVPYGTVAEFLNYIYDHLDCFRLLIMCAEGTEYADFVENMVRLEVKGRERMFALLRQKKIPFHELDAGESHLLTHSYFASIFDVVTHGFTREEALRYGRTLVTFYNAGMRAIIGI